MRRVATSENMLRNVWKLTLQTIDRRSYRHTLESSSISATLASSPSLSRRYEIETNGNKMAKMKIKARARAKSGAQVHRSVHNQLPWEKVRLGQQANHGTKYCWRPGHLLYKHLEKLQDCTVWLMIQERREVVWHSTQNTGCGFTILLINVITS